MFLSGSRFRLSQFIAFCFLTFCFATASADATENEIDAPTVLISEDGSVTTYLAAYFKPFNPFSLRDMIDRIPGVSISSSSATEERRGLRGNEDAILVNGQQVTGKDSGGISSLQRVRASNVKHIEVIRGSTAELQGTTGRIINIVLEEDAGSSLTISTAFLNYAGDNTFRINPQINYNSISPQQSYTLELKSSRIYRPWERSKVTTDATGAEISMTDESEQRRTNTTTFTGRLDRSYNSGAQLQLNGLLQAVLIDRDRDETLEAAGVIPIAPPFFDILEKDNRDRHTAEISADYNFSVGDGKRITTLGVFNWEKETRDRSVRDRLLQDSPVALAQNRTDLRIEAIGRSVFDWTINDESSLQLGFEGAFNSQKTDFDLRRLENGALTPVPVFNSNGRVQEYRGEVFTSMTRTMRDDLTVETGLAVEASQITQTGVDVDSARSLIFVKPSLTSFWDVAKNAKIVFSVARDVDQLNFTEFVSSISERDEELKAGNPDLLPERSWDFDLGVEYRLAGGAGVMNLTGFYRRVEDVSGRRVFQSLVSQPSNIGTGSEFGFEAEASLQLSQIGLWSGVFSATYLRRNTSVVDPITGVSRSFDQAPNWEFELDYRHDINLLLNNDALKLNFTQDAPSLVHDVNYVEATDNGPQLRVGYTGQITKSILLDFSITNTLNSELVLDRRLFSLSPDLERSDAGQRIERHQWGRLFTLFIQASF